VVDQTVGSETLWFLDAYSGYHQISLSEAEQLSTVFITLLGCYCYIKMSFGLKNADVTY
jgi:hypothetical protein